MTEGKPQVVPDAVLRFDSKKLPPQPLLDTGVWMRALGWRQDDRTTLCRDLVAAIEHHKLKALIAAPTVAELLRFDETLELPDRRHIVVVSFDKKAAIELQKLCAPWRNDGQNEGRRLKFDAMITACAVRWKATSIIHLDEDFKKATPHAENRGVIFRSPADYLMPVEQQIERSKDAERKTSAAKPKS